MQNKKKLDLQTLSLFFILGALTLILVFFFQMVIFSPHPLVEMATK